MRIIFCEATFLIKNREPVERLSRLIGRRGIAGDIKRRQLAIGFLDFDRSHGGVRARKFQRQLIVPGPRFGRLFAILQPDFAAG